MRAQSETVYNWSLELRVMTLSVIRYLLTVAVESAVSTRDCRIIPNFQR